MNSPKDDNLSNENEEQDEFQEKLDFEENDSLEDCDSIKNDDESLICLNDNNLDEENEIEKNIVIKLVNVKTNGEDGELNDDESDDDLEEGELKDDDDPINQSLDYLIQKNEQKTILCKFYSNGNCSWGDLCRFKHCDLAKNNQQQTKPTNRLNQSTNYYQKPQYNNTKYNNNEFENRNDLDFEATSKFNEQQENSNRNVYVTRNKYENRFNYNNQFNSQKETFVDKDYERKRRLALESAPWNEYDQDYFVDFKSQSSSIVPKDSFHSNHSDSSSFSDLDFSSNSEKSFKQKQQQQQQQQQSPRDKKRKFNDESSPLPPSLPPPLDYDYSRKSQQNKKENNNYESSSSFFSDSDSLNDKNENKFKAARPPSSPPTCSSKYKPSSKELNAREYYRSSKENSKTLDANTPSHYRSRTKTTNSARRRRSIEQDEDEKKPTIKMTFMKKQSSLSRGIKLNDSKDEEESADSDDDFSLYGNSKEVSINKTVNKTSREELLKRLKEIDEAIARKRSKV